jgi:transposase
MFLRRINKKKSGKDHYYWALVESYRTEKGARQRVICYLGDCDKAMARSVQHTLDHCDSYQLDFISPGELPTFVEIDPRKIRTERQREFGGVWLGLQLYETLGFDQFFSRVFIPGREQIDWPSLIKILVISRFYCPSSELHLAEHVYEHSAFEDLIGVPAGQLYDNRLYRCLDRLLPHKDALQKHLKERMGSLFGITYDLVLYDVTSTYFEGSYDQSRLAKRGYSRDGRPDCKQVCLALVVTKEGLPLGYEVFAGNTHDSQTVKEIVGKIETLYGVADRIWVWDRGMSSAETIEFLRTSGRRYIIGTPRSALKAVEKELVEQSWEEVCAGVEVKTCQAPDQSAERFILCRSKDRAQKEKAMHDLFVRRIEEGVAKLQATCDKRQRQNIVGLIERRVGRLLGQNSRGSGLFDIRVLYDHDAHKTMVQVIRKDAASDWLRQTEGHYLLRTNITDRPPQELWKAYIHLTDAEEAFHIHKQDLQLRPIYHHKDERILGHILVCFLSFVLWKTFALKCKNAGLGDEPRRVIEEINRIAMADVVLTTKQGQELKIRTVIKPDKPTAYLLHKLGWRLPERLTKRIL